MSSSDLKADRSLRIIIPSVVAFHFLIALMLNGLNSEPIPLTPKKGVVVHSVKLSPKVHQNPVKETAISKKEVAVAKEVSREVSREPAKTKPKPVTAPPPKPAVSKPAPEKKPEKKIAKPLETKKATTPDPKIEKEKPDSKAWIAAAKEKIGKIAPPSDSISTSSASGLKEIATPMSIDSLVTDLSFMDSGASFSVKESAYRDELAKRLKLHLRLPEYGEVKIKLTVDRAGTVIFTKVLSFQSAKNASFVEQNLPKIKMPPFGDNFKGASSFDFTIVMSNE